MQVNLFKINWLCTARGPHCAVAPPCGREAVLHTLSYGNANTFVNHYFDSNHKNAAMAL